MTQNNLLKKYLCKQQSISNILKKNWNAMIVLEWEKNKNRFKCCQHKQLIFMKNCLWKWVLIVGAVVKTSYLERTKQLFNSTCKASFWPSSHMNPYTVEIPMSWMRRTSKDACDSKLTAWLLNYLAWPSHQSQRARERGNIAKQGWQFLVKSGIWRRQWNNVPCKLQTLTTQRKLITSCTLMSTSHLKASFAGLV